MTFWTEIGFFYHRHLSGQETRVAVAGAFDRQDDFHGYDADAFVDLPFGIGAVTAQFDYNHFNQSTTLTTLPKQDVVSPRGRLPVTAARLRRFSSSPIATSSTRRPATIADGRRV